MKTKTLCLMLSLLTAASVCVAAPTSVGIYDIQPVRFDRAADNFLPLASGKCGSNLNRRLYDDGRLTGTGAKITVKGKTYTVVIKGDIDGDGKISTADYIRVRKHILRITKPDGSALLAAHTSTDVSKQVSAADYIAIRMHILTHTSLGTTGIWLS